MNMMLKPLDNVHWKIVSSWITGNCDSSEIDEFIGKVDHCSVYRQRHNIFPAIKSRSVNISFADYLLSNSEIFISTQT